MDGASRQSAPDLVSAVRPHAKEFNFFKLVDLLLKEQAFEIEERELFEQAVKNAIFRVNPSLGFPSGDIAAIEEIENIFGEVSAEISVNFLGLHGTSSPLPSHMLEASLWSRNEEGVQQAFNDFFSNRLIWLFYLIWRKYRYHIRYRSGATDQFSDWMFALIGIKGREARGQAGIPWAKLLTYLGVVAAQTRSAEMIKGVIAHAFGLSDISIREFEERSVEIPDDQRAINNRANMTLGSDMVIGSFVQDRASKFTIVIKDLSFQRFRDFLPSGAEYPRLKELVEFLLKDQLSYDLELHFTRKEAPDFVLGKETLADLGWTTFVGGENKQHLRPVTLQVRA